MMPFQFGNQARRLSLLRAYAQSAGFVIIATLIGLLIQSFVSPTNVVMVYLLAVVMVAIRLGYGPAVAASMLSVVVFNFFFVPPQLTLRVADAEYLLTFAGLFIVGVVIANLTAQVLEQAEAAREREAQTAALYALSKDLSITTDLDATIQTTLIHIQETFGAEAAIYLRRGSQLVMAHTTSSMLATAITTTVLDRACQHGEPVETAPALPGFDRLLVMPLRTAQGTLGALALGLSTSFAIATHHYILSAFSHQAALAIEAAQLAETARMAELLHERDKLQTALLNSISHDLRTPLVSITGALSSLHDHAALYDEQARQDLITGAWQEAQRLNRLVANLLEMTRIEAGAVQLNQEYFDVAEIMGVARTQLQERLRDRKLDVVIAPDLPLVYVDISLMTLVLVNLLDNALKYAAPERPIEIRAGIRDTCVLLEIADYGPGIPEADLPHIFEKFYRSPNSQHIRGTGLGLSICEAIVEAHGGTIRAANRAEGGAVFTIALPTQDSVSACGESQDHA